MTCDQQTARTLYKRLLGLYPRAFRERLGESMEQTFNDLWNERKQQTEHMSFGFVLWLFADTAMGIIKEHTLLVRQGDVMKNLMTNLRSPAIISCVLVVPFVILELVNRRNFNEGFPIVLFGYMWILPMVFIAILTPMVRNVRAGNSAMAAPFSLFLKVAFLALIAFMWGGVLIDQFPCFMGVQHCD